MRRRVLSIVGFFGMSVAAIFWQGNSLAQNLYVTNLDQLVAEAYSSDHSIFLPLSPWDWRTYSIDGGEPWWINCSEMSCEGLFQTSTELSAGVPAYTVVLIQNVLTGETTVQPDGSTDVVATVAAPSGYQPGVGSETWMWNWYVQVTNCLDCWGLTAGDNPPPTITLKALLADGSNYAAYASYQSNLEAEAEAAQAASAGSGFFAMDDDDDDGGDPCSITNLTQPFYVTIITQAVNRATTITWQSCQIFRYLVFSTSVLNTNTQWVPQAYVWGATNASATSWTDTATTNDDGSTVTQRFYRVQRLAGNLIACGVGDSLAVETNGSLWMWGEDTMYQLGDGDTTNMFSPEEVSSNECNPQSISQVAGVGGGSGYSMAVDANGVVWTWGGGGLLGNGGNSNVFTPSPIMTLSNIVSVAAGKQQALALRADGTVWTWGSDIFGYDSVGGALGAGYDLPSGFTNAPIQCQIPNKTNIVAIAEGGNGFGIALDTTGQVWGWGDNEDGEIGTNVLTGIDNGTNSPVLVPGISNVIAIAVGAAHSMALTADKRVWTWGADSSGQLGWNANQNNPNPTPEPVSGLSNVVAIAGGYDFSLAVTSNGNVYAWGGDDYGQLGTNGPSQLTNATKVAGISNAVSVAASFANNAEGYYALATTLSQGTNQFWAWGDDDQGQVGNGTNVYAVYTPYEVPFTYYNACAECIQLGTNGTFTAYATGTLFLYFNDNKALFSDNSGAYTVTVTGVVSGATVPATYEAGVIAGIVSNGVMYSYSASGICTNCTSEGCGDNASGVNNATGEPSVCPSDMSNFICPALQCYSLVGKIE
jgi:alpha-tubulin suppressor-like RCC1 family protein